MKWIKKEKNCRICDCDEPTLACRTQGKERVQWYCPFAKRTVKSEYHCPVCWYKPKGCLTRFCGNCGTKLED